MLSLGKRSKDPKLIKAYVQQKLPVNSWQSGRHANQTRRQLLRVATSCCANLPSVGSRSNGQAPAPLKLSTRPTVGRTGAQLPANGHTQDYGRKNFFGFAENFPALRPTQRRPLTVVCNDKKNQILKQSK